jgi:hypothetical protein
MASPPVAARFRPFKYDAATWRLHQTPAAWFYSSIAIPAA